MDAAVWTLIAILGAFSFGVLALQVGQNARIDAVRDRTDDRFERFEAKVDQGFREIRQEIREFRTEMEQRLDRLERRLEEHEAQHQP